jgi:hypothetical protein
MTEANNLSRIVIKKVTEQKSTYLWNSKDSFDVITKDIQK